MLAIASSVSAGFNAGPALTPTQHKAPTVRMETVSDLEALAKECNPIVGFWDPIGLANMGTSERAAFSESASIGWLRHAEIKHGRVAMAAFVGYIAQANGAVFPWNLQNDQPIFHHCL